jgi:hypothetical protein
LIGPNVGILHHVFGFAVIPQDGSRDAIDALIALFERLQLW